MTSRDTGGLLVAVGYTIVVGVAIAYLGRGLFWPLSRTIPLAGAVGSCTMLLVWYAKQSR